MINKIGKLNQKTIGENHFLDTSIWTKILVKIQNLKIQFLGSNFLSTISWFLRSKPKNSGPHGRFQIAHIAGPTVPPGVADVQMVHLQKEKRQGAKSRTKKTWIACILLIIIIKWLYHIISYIVYYMMNYIIWYMYLWYIYIYTLSNLDKYIQIYN